MSAGTCPLFYRDNDCVPSQLHGFEEYKCLLPMYTNLHAFHVTSMSYRSFAIRVSQLKTCDFTGENFKGFEVLKFSMIATTTKLLSNGEFCRLRHDTIPD